MNWCNDMCLQYCHVLCKVFDNDFPCDHCPHDVRYAHDADRCSTCRYVIHRTINGANDNICSLTHQKLPASNSCCHWNTDLHPSEDLVLTLRSIEPDTMNRHGARSVSELFDISETAPDYQVIDDNTIVVPLDDLAVPYVYGLSSWDWEEALGIKLFVDIDDLEWLDFHKYM